MGNAPPHMCPGGCHVVLPAGVPRCPKHTLAKERNRPNVDVRLWYRQARWKALRKCVLDAQPLCADCLKQGRATVATDVHHRVKHNGNPERFYESANLEPLCASCHAKHTGRGE